MTPEELLAENKQLKKENANLFSLLFGLIHVDGSYTTKLPLSEFNSPGGMGIQWRLVGESIEVEIVPNFGKIVDEVAKWLEKE